MELDLQRTVRELSDRQAIWNVLLRYARGLDRIDAELVRGCYFDDAIEDHGHFVGTPDDFVRWACRVSESFVTTQHGLLNHYCELAGDDAYCETYFLFSGVRSEAPHFLSTGRYADHFQRRNGEWRIANRVTVVEGKFDVPEAAVSAAMPSAYGPGESDPGRRDRDDVSYHRPPRPRTPR